MLRVRDSHFKAPRVALLAAAAAALLFLNYGLPDDSFRAHAFLLVPLRYATEAAGGPAWLELYNAAGQQVGFISADERFRLAPECSGLRFFSLTLALGALLGAANWPGALWQFSAAYGLALLATTARIVALARLAAVAPVFAAENHAWIGGVIYLSFFIMYGLMLVRSRSAPVSPSTSTPTPTTPQRDALPGDVP